MCGTGAMSVRADSDSLEGCDSLESRVCHGFACTFVRAAGAVIEGEKPAAIFSVRIEPAGTPPGPQTRNALRDAVRTYEVELPLRGITLTTLGERSNRIQLLAYRPNLVAEVLGDPATRSFLKGLGYPVDNVAEFMGTLRRRLAAHLRGEGVPFPHEIGVVLGYPLEDVLGYMHGASETCRGPWRSYGDARTAELRFLRVACSERACRERFVSGLTLDRLLA